LVELNISVWTANKLDRGQTDKVNNDNAAARNAAKVHKYLMTGSSERDDIAKYAAGLRSYHLWQTLPWADKGPRLLPISKVFEYKKELQHRIDQYHALVDVFVRKYPTLMENAKQMSTGLGALFNPNDYPSEQEIRSKFGARLVISPLPDAGDFRAAS
jgi:hypothetical protein